MEFPLLPDRRIRRWLGAFVGGNLVALVCTLLWSPSVGFDIFSFSHARFATLALTATIAAMALSVIGLALRRTLRIAFWLLLAVQVMRMLPVAAAVNVWPGGDDGAKIGWTGVVLPVNAVLALGSVVICVLAFTTRHRAPASAGARG